MGAQRSPRGGPGGTLVPHRRTQSRSKIHHQSTSFHPRSESQVSNLHPRQPKAKNPTRDGEKERDSEPVAAGVCRSTSPTRSANPLRNPPRNPPNSCLDPSLEAQIECPTSCVSPPPAVGVPPPFADVAKANPISPVSSSTAEVVRSWADVVRSSQQQGVGIPRLIEENRKDACFRGVANQWPQPVSNAERSLIFKRWARGRCFRCLAFDHQVRFCKAPFRCIRCFGPGHRERHCCFQATSSSSRVLPYENHSPPLFAPRHQQTHTTQAGFAAKNHSSPPKDDVANEATAQGKKSQLSLPSVASGRMAYSDVSASSDSKDAVSTLLESLRSELMHLFEVQFEMMLRPIREEMSVIKVWLARVAAHFECQKQDKELPSTLNIGELFGPYSPVRLSTTPTLLETLVAKHSSVGRLEHEGVCADMAISSTNQAHVEQSGQKVSKSLQAVGQVVDVVPAESSSVIEPTPDVHMATKDIDIEAIVQEGHAYVDELTNNSSALDATTTVSHSRKSCGKSLSRRRSHSSEYNFLKGLGLIKKNGKIDKGKFEEFADLLKELLPPDLLVSLLRLKGHAFWKTLAKISASLL